MTLVDVEHWPKLHLVPMSVEPHRYPTMSERRRGRSGPLRVLFVGRLVPEKGLQVLVDAVRALPPGEVEVRIVGDGPLRAKVGDELREAGLLGSVTLVGALGQDELPAQYEWADVFCMTSFAEGLPVVLMEAMSTGLPVVAPRITGIPELVEDGVTGLLVTPGRADLVRDALHRLATDAGLRDRLGRAGIDTVRERHSPQLAAERLVPLLREATHRP
jgi:glycosyltransferase involved in cell wall biosynthesis